MIKLPYNPISTRLFLPLPVKRISISTPDKADSDIMIQITWDAGMDMRIPELEVPDISSPDAIIERRKAVTVSGWSRMADTYVLIDAKWNDPSQIEQWVSEIGWCLGAGYMYRWHNAPGSAHKHLWGLVKYSVAGDDLQIGDSSEELSELTEKYGCWSWEINSAYRKADGHSKIFWSEWYRADISLDPDGSRSTPFPGWDGHHSFLRATEPQTGYESHYFFCPTWSGKGKSKRMKKERGACYIKNLKWETREHKV